MEENNEHVESSATDNENGDDVDALLELKRNTVPRSEYEALKAKNTKLLNAVIKGTPVEDVAKKKNIDELRKAFNKKGQTNLEYVTNMMALRDALIEEGYQDPFIPVGHHVTPDMNDIQGAEKMAEIYKHCIEKAEGNSDVFTAELMRFCKTTPFDNIPQRRR